MPIITSLQDKCMFNMIGLSLGILKYALSTEAYIFLLCQQPSSLKIENETG